MADQNAECYMYKKNNKKMKEESLMIYRPFIHVVLDFAGPILAKGIANSRAKLKVWILFYCCRSFKAVGLLPTAGYDTSY